MPKRITIKKHLIKKIINEEAKNMRKDRERTRKTLVKLLNSKKTRLEALRNALSDM